MPAKKSKRQPFRPNTIWIFVSIIIVLAILWMIVSYFYVEEDKPDVLLLPSTEQDDTQVDTQSPLIIAGSWVSNYDGAILTLNNNAFTLEISGLDVSSKTTGPLAVEGNIVTFVNSKNEETCPGIEGHYLYAIEDNGEIFFKLIKDPCESRRERMTATWFRL
jgi:hypothetical protein